MRRSIHGLSLLEMLLVVALLAAISVLAATAMGGGFAGMQLRSEAKKLVAQLRYTRAQRGALASGRSGCRPGIGLGRF